MFDWNDLRHFLAIARHGSTLAAAKALAVSQSTVHRRMDELERQVGRQLVTRNPAGYKLTELGEDLVAYAERVEEAALAFERRIAGADKSLTGSVRVTCPEPVGIRLMQSNLLAKFSERFPGLRIEFVMSDKLLDLGKREADIALRAADPVDNALFGRKIADVPWALYASNGYVARHGAIKDAADIANHALVLFDVELKQHFTNRWLQSTASGARIAARCNSVAALIAAIRSGAGLGALPVIVGDNDAELVRVLGPLPELTTHFYLLIHEDMKATPRIRAFFDFLVEEIRELRIVVSGSAPAREPLVNRQT
ncbi:MAG TPA: LysR family transcriptional regulator [Pseudolabrys sp.]|nr:LysR family transcriptional regulator [Pseudolabrys sp.]